MNFKRYYKVALPHKFSWSTSFRQGNDGPLNFFLNLDRSAFWLFVFSELNKYEIFDFNETFTMYRCALCY